MANNTTEQAKLVLFFQDKASAAMKKVGSDWGKMVGSIAAGNLVAKAATKAMNFLKQGVVELVDATKLAARIEVLNNTFQMIGENALYSSAQLTQSRNSLMALGIAEKEALEIGNRFIQSQLDIADATKVARAAQDLAVVAGTNSSETALRLTDAIVKQRPILLKQFGIIADLNDIYGRQATQLGKSVDQLDKTEKRQAFLNEILRQATSVAGSYENAMLDVGKRMTSVPRYMQAAQKAIGTWFLPAMELAVDGSIAFLKATEAAFAPRTDILVKATNKLREAGNKFKVTSEKIKLMRDEYSDLVKVSEPSADQQARMNELLIELEGLMPGVVLSLNNQTEAMKSNLEILDDIVERREESRIKEEQDLLKELGLQYNTLTRALEQYKIEQEIARMVVFAQTTATDDQRAAIIEQLKVMEQGGGIAANYSDNMGALSSSAGLFSRALRAAKNPSIDFNDNLVESTAAISEAEAKINDLDISLSDLFPDLEKNKDAQEGMTIAMRDSIIAFQEQEAAELEILRLEKEIAEMKEYNIILNENAEAGFERYQAASQAAFLSEHEGLVGLSEDYFFLAETKKMNAELDKKEYEIGIKQIDDKTNEVVAANSKELKSTTDTKKKQKTTTDKFWNEVAGIAENGMSQIGDVLRSESKAFKPVWQSMANDFMDFFIKQALAAILNVFIPGLGSLLGGIFDTPANDRMAATQGVHFSQWFIRGALGELADFPLLYAHAAVGGQPAAGGGAAIGGAVAPSGGNTFVFTGPMTDEAFIIEKVVPLIEGDGTFGLSSVQIDYDNITGDDDARQF